MNCEHMGFETDVKIARLTGETLRFSAEITIRCAECREPFRFRGVPAGFSFDHPTVSIDALELNAPIEPEVVKTLLDRATYQMPHKAEEGKP